MSTRSSTVEVAVFDFRADPVPGAGVVLAPAQGDAVEAKFNERSGVHRADGLRPGRYRLSVEAKGYGTQEREVDIPEGLASETVVLGHPDMPVVYRDRVPFPFEPREDLLGISAEPSEEAARLEELLRELDVAVETVAEAADAQGIRLLRLSRTDEAGREEIVERLRAHRAVQRIGPVIALNEERVIFATEELVVRFEPWVTEGEVTEFAERHRLEPLRSFSYAGNAYLFRAGEPPSYGLLERFAEIAGLEQVRYAEPNLVSSVVLDQVVPEDHLYSDQWHLPYIGLPDAWQVLRDHNPPGTVLGGSGDLTFGSEDVVIAVMDQGIESRDVGGTTTPHPDFSGNVSSGDPKMYTWINWATLARNNNNPSGSHGTSCAGVAAANAGNPSTVAGEDEGVVGAAGNCRLIGMSFPSGPETDYSDAYIWAAGFDPHSSRAGFPAQLPRGADVFSNSYGAFEGSPISGLMKDCFDHLATYGRGGRGAVCFFSAGNANAVFNLRRPWAAYERNFAIAASTDGDVRAGYSNFGNGIDLCAPSNGGTDAITTTDRVGLGTVAGHTGGTNDYTAGFGGTSSATPFTAGLAALLISINPTLTCVELRQILQSTAVRIDPGNTDLTGQWVDTDGDGVDDYSQWYGHGRIGAHAAVVAARDFAHDIDLVVRDNLGDVGAVPVSGTWWLSPDLWVRTQSPATDGAAALPASYSDPPPHQSPVEGSATNHVYARIRNFGTRASSDYYVRFYISHYPGVEFTYPASFIPTTRPSEIAPTPLRPGTYLIGEVHRLALAAGAVEIVSQEWPQALVPPESAVVGGMTVHWHPCLLLEVSPHDGPVPGGPNVWDDNNLTQRNLTVVHPDDGADFEAGIAIGDMGGNGHRERGIEIDRATVPPWVRLYVAFPNHRRLPIDRRSSPKLQLGEYGDRQVIWLDARERTRFQLDLGEEEGALMTVGAAEMPGDKPLRGRVDVVQTGRFGTRLGGYAIELGGKR